jgi:hypothetical protein
VTELVFRDLGDSAHGAFFHTLAATDAGVLVRDLNDPARNFQHFLRARIYADTTANALVSIDNRMSHDDSFLALK